MAEVWTPPALNDVSTTELVTAAQLNAFGNSLRFLSEISYQEQATDVTVTATLVGSAGTIVSAGAFTYEASPILIEFQCGTANPGADDCYVILRDSSTVLGTLCRLTSGLVDVPINVSRRLTPTAASHTYNVAAWNASAATAVFNAGSGGTAGDPTTDFPIFIRVTRVPT